AALVAAGAQTATAGEREWAETGKILTGGVAASVITRTLDSQPCYAAPRVVIAPAPVVVYRAPVCVASAPRVNVRFGNRHWDRDDFRGGYHYRQGYHRR
ncbi:MAG TPA: hypothetical protein VKA67_00820, partial [Verrucomicrobiae bacterium]|nr:hypothetical protein [Verrucomicrobiae bacterium]